MVDFDLLCVGDAVLDTFLTINNESEFCTLNPTTKQITLHSGEKILVDKVDFMLGGNACNVSVGAKRLGLKSGLVAEFGGDEFAQKIKKGLAKEGVNTDFTSTTEDAPSTFSVGLHIAGERTLFVHHVTRKHAMSLNGIQTKWIYLTSLGHEWEGLYKRVLELAKSTGAKIAFNPGSQQLKDGVEKFKDILETTEMLCVNRDEAEEILYGRVRTASEKETPENLLFRLLRVGPKAVCMTDGENGSFAMDSEGHFYEEGIVKPKSFTGKTGAGDAYASGFISAIILGKDIQEAMKWGAIEAASVLEHIGAQTGLLARNELEQRLGENKSKNLVKEVDDQRVMSALRSE